MKQAVRGKHEMRDHYDFRAGVRGKCAARHGQGTNVVVLDPDVAKTFPDRRSVNEALRAVGQVVEMSERRKAGAIKGAPPPPGGHGAARAKFPAILSARDMDRKERKRHGRK